MNLRTCPRCRTPLQPGGTFCERCELPVDAPAAVARYNPAGLATPSPIQGHATVLVGIVLGVALLAFGAWYALHGVGPFHATIMRQVPTADRSGIVVDLQVSNDGSRPGKARCQVSGEGTDGQLRDSGVQLSPNVPAHGSVSFQLTVPGLTRNADSVTCG